MPAAPFRTLRPKPPQCCCLGPAAPSACLCSGGRDAERRGCLKTFRGMSSLAGELSPQALSGEVKAPGFSLWPGADRQSAGRPPTVTLEAGAAPFTGVAGSILTQMESRPRLLPLGAWVLMCRGSAQQARSQTCSHPCRECPALRGGRCTAHGDLGLSRSGLCPHPKGPVCLGQLWVLPWFQALTLLLAVGRFSL